MKITEFWTRVAVGADDACWPWLGAIDSTGYGRVRLYGRMRHAHRVAFSLRHAAPPEGLLACHSCDERTCCNPAHLWLGTHAENSRDMMRKGRHRLAPLRGEACPSVKLTEAKVRHIRSSSRRSIDLAHRYGVSRTQNNKHQVWQVLDTRREQLLNGLR
jgi:HNH endonuclease